MSRRIYQRNKETLRDNMGRLITVPNTFGNFDELIIQQENFKYEVTKNTINIFDTEITNQKRIDGGSFWVCPDDVGNVGKNDYIEFSVVDKNDVLGLFSTYGLTVGEDIIELNKFIKSNYVKKGDKNNGYYDDLSAYMKGALTLLEGLFLRMIYDSVDSSGTIHIISRMYYYI